MEKKLKKLLDASVFKHLVLEGKQGIFTDELYMIGEKIWNEAQSDLIDKLLEFERQEKMIIITESDRNMLHGFDFTQVEHIEKKKKLKEFLNENK